MGPKSGLKLIKEHGNLKTVIKVLREKQAEREEANALIKKEEPESEDEPEPETEDEKSSVADKSSPAPKQKAKKPANRIADSDDDSDADKPMKSEPESDEDKPPKMEEDSDGEGASSPAKASKSSKSKGKSKAKKATKPKAKGKGGITVPEYWPWEEAKELFMKPNVTPADELEVSGSSSTATFPVLQKFLQLIWEAPDVEGLVDFLAKDKGFKCVAPRYHPYHSADGSP